MIEAKLKTFPNAAPVWSVVAAFGAYFCMYGFRKPFTAAGYDEVVAFGLAYKPLAIAAQVLGYMAAKFIGIKVIAELDPGRRVTMLVGLVGASWGALVGFGATPAPWNVGWLFLNGLALGMVFGLVLGFLEGRRHTEAMAAGLCTSFIVADGVTKSVGSWLMQAGTPEFWMPAAAGLLFAAPLAVFAWMLTRIPPPSPADVAARSERLPMNRSERREFFRRYRGGLTLLVGMYVLITILRSVRSDFAPEIWDGLGVDVEPGIYAWTEMAVALGVLVLNGSAVFIRDNRRAYFYALALATGGAALVALLPIALRGGMPPLAFVILQGLGLYLPYIAVHTTIFERLIAMTRDRGNIGYLMYLADAFGYLGYVAVLMARNVSHPSPDFLPFFISLSWMIALACIALLIPCWRYFSMRAMAQAPVQTAASPPPPAAEWTAVGESL